MRLALLLFAASTAVIVAPATGAGQESAPDSAVSLRFAWPKRVAARVEAERHRVRRLPQRSDSGMVAITYMMRAEPHADGRLIRFEEFAFPGLPARGGEPLLSEIMQRVSGMVPSFIVNEGGEFVRLENLAALRWHTDSLLASLSSGLSGSSAGNDALAALRSMMTDEALTASASEEWNSIVGQWVGADLEPGEVYLTESEEPFLIIPGMTLPYEFEFSLTRRLPCTEGEIEERCAELVMLSYPEPNAVARALEGFVRQLGLRSENAGTPLFRELEIENTLMIVIETSTLLPHAASIRRELNGIVSAPGEPEQRMHQVDLRTWRYTYLER